MAGRIGSHVGEWRGGRARRERMVAKPRGSKLGKDQESYAWTRNGNFLGETASPGGEGGRGGFRKRLSSYGDRWFESPSLQRGVTCEPRRPGARSESSRFRDFVHFVRFGDRPLAGDLFPFRSIGS